MNDAPPPMGKLRIAIVGSRDFPDLRAVAALAGSFNPTAVTIVSGGCRGVDKVAEDAARAAGIEVETMPADWRRHGRAAGPIRNTEIVNRADVVIAFWDRVSRGTDDAMRKARKAGKTLLVCSQGATT